MQHKPNMQQEMTNIEKFGKVTHDNLPQAVEHLINLMSEQAEHQIELEPSRSDEEDEIGIKEASILLKKSPSTIYRYTCNRAIPFYKIGNSLRFRKTELTEWIKAQKTQITERELNSGSITLVGLSITEENNKNEK